MDPSTLITLILMVVSFTLISFVSFAFRGRRDDPAFSNGLYMGMIFLFIALIMFILNILKGHF